MTPDYKCPACDESVHVDPMSHDTDLVQCLACGYRAVLDLQAGKLRRDPNEDDVESMLSPTVNQD